jgi:hypothetical protein
MLTEILSTSVDKRARYHVPVVIVVATRSPASSYFPTIVEWQWGDRNTVQSAHFAASPSSEFHFLGFGGELGPIIDPHEQSLKFP